MEQSERQKLYNWFMARPGALRLLRVCNTGFTASVYVGYVLLCLWLLIRLDLRLIRVVVVPCVVFLCGSKLRSTLNFPRPYQNGGVPALLAKETEGKSFPSRHVFCAAVITAAWLWILPAVGCCYIAITCVIAALRVLGGVHWPRDVLAGIAFGGVLGWFGFFILP